MSDTVAEPAVQNFPLVFTEGEKRFVLKFTDEGIALDGRGLSWTVAGGARGRSLGDIAGIRLRRLPTPGADTGQCTIAFAGGEILNIMSWTPAGFPDDARAKTYREFIAALHRRLSPADRARIAFTSGFPGAGAGWQRPVGIAALLAAGLLFVMAPLGVALFADDPKGYWLAFAGTLLTSGLYWKVRHGFALNEANAPQTYSPDQVPAAMLP